MREWYIETREWLIEALTEGGYPYGSVRLTPAEQLTRYRGMTAQGRSDLFETFLERYRGHPDALRRAQETIERYDLKMAALGRRMMAQEEEGFGR